MFKSLANKEMQIKTKGNIITYLLKWLKLKKSVTLSNKGRDTEKLDNLIYILLVGSSGKEMAVSSKLNMQSPHNQVIRFPQEVVSDK